MKRLAVLRRSSALGLVLAFLLVSCTSSGPPENTAVDKVHSITLKDLPITIGLLGDKATYLLPTFGAKFIPTSTAASEGGQVIIKIVPMNWDALKKNPPLDLRHVRLENVSEIIKPQNGQVEESVADVFASNRHVYVEFREDYSYKNCPKPKYNFGQPTFAFAMRACVNVDLEVQYSVQTYNAATNTWSAPKVSRSLSVKQQPIWSNWSDGIEDKPISSINHVPNATFMTDGCVNMNNDSRNLWYPLPATSQPVDGHPPIYSWGTPPTTMPAPRADSPIPTPKPAQRPGMARRS